MNASKEEARKAQRAFVDYRRKHGTPADELADAIDYFLLAAERKLPTEASYQRDRKRRTA